MKERWSNFVAAANDHVGTTPADLVENYDLPEGFADLAETHWVENVPVAGLTFFPTERPLNLPDLPERGLVVAAGYLRAFVLSEEGGLIEIDIMGKRAAPFSLAEVLAFATPLVGVSLKKSGELTFIDPDEEKRLRETMGVAFDQASDLFAIPLLQNLKAELTGRAKSASLLMGVATVMALGIGLVVTVLESVAAQVGFAIVLGCIPLTLLVMGMRAKSKANIEVRRIEQMESRLR